MKIPEYRLFRIFSVLLISCCLLLYCGLPAAMAEEASGACGEQLDWTLYQDGTLTVSGSGPMMDFTGPSGAPWAGRKSSISRVVLEPGVTTVGSYAFYACTGISEAVLPDTLVSVGDYAFTMCASLTGITFPAGMEAIGQSAFYNCRKLTALDIPGSISAISAEAFRKTGITDLVIREGVTKIDSYAFFGTPIVRVFLPASVRTVSPGAFADCRSLATVIYSGTAEEAAGIQIGTENTCLSAAEWVDRNGDPLLAGPSGGICGADLSWTLSADGTLTISGSGEMDHYSADSGAPWESRKGQITKVVVETGVTALGSRAFHGCGSLEEVILPEGLLSLGNYAFCLCTSLSTIVLPDTVTKIGDSCFEQCGALTAVQLPASLQTIGWYAFSSCATLEEITFPASLKEIGRSAFSICPKLTTVVIPGSVASVSTEAFEYSGLETLILLDGVREIEGYAFSGTPLQSIQLPASVKVISPSAFAQCENLETVCYTGTREEAAGIVIGSGNSCLDMASWQYLSVPQDPSQTFTLPSDLRVIGPEAFDGTAAEAVVIPASVQEIASGAFGHCSALRLLVFEGSPSQIAADALGSCTDVIISVSPGSTAEAWAAEQHCSILYH